MNYFVIAFAVNDFLTGSIVIPLGIIHEIEYVQGYMVDGGESQTKEINRFTSQEERLFHHFEPIGTGFCDILQMSIAYTGYMSVWLMTAIAADRYYRIKNPVIYKTWMTRSRALTIILSLYFVCGWMCYGYYRSHKNSGVEYDPAQCVFYITTNFVTFTVAMTTMFLPFLAMVFYYVRLILMCKRSRQAIRGSRREKTLCCRRRRSGSRSENPLEMRQVVDSGVVEGSGAGASSSTSPANTTTTTAAANANPCITTSEDPAGAHRQRTLRRSVKASRLIGLILFAYAIFVFPSTMIYVLYTFTPELKIEETGFIYLYPWVTFVNSAVNPVIYFFITRDLRERAYRILQQYRHE